MKGVKIDITGHRFGRLVAQSRAPNNKEYTCWRCVCDCGKPVVVRTNALRNGHTQSCGCLHLELLAEKKRTHGQHKSRTYSTWRNMLTRCTNPKNGNYFWYGARGILVCERWASSFENFLADMGERPPKKTLDRIDNDGNYEPGNCRWATSAEQRSNTRRCVLFEHDGKRQPLAQWAKERGINKNTLYKRVNGLGWSLEKALRP